MRVVLQRVSSASVTVDGRVVGKIGRGFLLLVGFTFGDSESQINWMADKIVGLRVFADSADKMNLSIEEVGGEVLVVSQFTLYGNARRGRRPSFVDAAPPEQAERLYHEFVSAFRERGVVTETGVFGAMMDVGLVNDGPVTLIFDR